MVRYSIVYLHTATRWSQLSLSIWIHNLQQNISIWLSLSQLVHTASGREGRVHVCSHMHVHTWHARPVQLQHCALWGQEFIIWARDGRIAWVNIYWSKDEESGINLSSWLTAFRSHSVFRRSSSCLKVRAPLSLLSFCVFLDFSLDDLRTYVQTKPRNASQPRSPRMHPQLTILWRPDTRYCVTCSSSFLCRAHCPARGWWPTRGLAARLLRHWVQTYQMCQHPNPWPGQDQPQLDR